MTFSPRAEHEKKIRRRKDMILKFGVYFMLLLGTLVNQIIPEINLKAGSLDAELQPVYPVQIGVGAVIAIFLFSVFEKEGELEGKHKKIGRILRTAFFMGYFWNSILGKIVW